MAKEIFKSKYTGEQIEGKLDKVTEVLGNPEGSAVADLTKIQIGEYIYYLPYGTSVQGNPSTSATDELTKITIGGTTYSIPTGQSGSNIGGYDLYLNTNYGIITLKTIVYADGHKEFNRTFIEITTLHNVVAVVFSATERAMSVTGAIITKHYSDETVYVNIGQANAFIHTASGFTDNTQIILVGRCIMEWSSN